MEFLLYFNIIGIIVFFFQTILRFWGDYPWFFHLADIFLLITFGFSIFMIKGGKPKYASIMFFNYIFAILIFFVIGDLYCGVPNVFFSRLFYSATVLSLGILVNSIFSFNLPQVILFSLFSEIVLILHYIIIISIRNTTFFNLNSFSYLIGGIMTIMVITFISIMFLKLSHGIFVEIETDLRIIKKEQHDQLIIYNELLANMQTGLAYHQIITDSMKKPIDYVFLDINQAFCDLTGLKRERVIGLPITKIFPDILKDPANWIEIYGSVALDQQNVTFEQFFQELKKWFLITAYSPKKGYFVTIITDISERKNQEQEVLRQQKLTSISELAGGIAHDFNNLLAGILGNINLLQQSDSLNVEDKEILYDLELVTQRAKGLTRQLLTFSKGGVPIKKEFNLIQILQNAINLVCRGKSFKVNSNFESEDIQIFADPDQIHQVAVNLLINSSQAISKEGIIKITTTIVNNEEIKFTNLPKGNYMKVVIYDNGPGIPDHIKNRIFEPYFSTKSDGNGLGLATSYSIIQKHNGFINFTSNEKEGTEFFFFIPMSISALNTNLEIKSKKNEIVASKILILDDEPHIHKLFHRIFKKLKFSIDSSFDGLETIKMYQQAYNSNQPYDIVILDLIIPGGMGGLETFQRISEFDPQVKAIVSSGYSNDPVIANYKKFGFQAELSKPFSIEQVYQVLATIQRKNEILQ